MAPDPLLTVRNLSVTVQGARVVDGLSFDLAAGEVLGVVGESGSGKTLSALAIMGLSNRHSIVHADQLRSKGHDLLAMTTSARASWRGAEASMIFQDPRGALNPIRPVGQQIADVISRHDPAGAAPIHARVLEALAEVRLPDPQTIAKAYPHELSGGQCQRIGIATALASQPQLLVADEPTTGLDTITQARIMGLIRDLVRARAMGMILITHDLALASGHCDRILVLHAGQMAEIAPVEAIFATPKHPLTAGLLRSTPSLAAHLDDLISLQGHPPDPAVMRLSQCRFAGRCDRHLPACDSLGPGLSDGSVTHGVRCRNPLSQGQL